jgi:hypothetical protein
MKIAILDPSGNHGHYAHTQSIIFKDENIEWFIHENVTKRLQDIGVFKNNNPKIHTYFAKNSKLFYYFKAIYLINRNKWDMVFFNTLQSDWLPNFIFFIFVKRTTNIVLTIHNVHSFFASNRKIGLKSFIKRSTKRLALKKSKLNLYSQKLKQCLLEYKPIPKVFLLPYQVYLPQTNKQNLNSSKKFKIIIPGTVDAKRRNYSLVLEIVEYFSNRKDIQFVLLGKPVGAGSDDLILKFKKYKDTVVCFHDFVDEDEFEKQMLTADIILGPLNKYFKTVDAIEEYGVSKETGITFAIIRYALPGIFPKELTIMDEISSAVKFYNNSSELNSIITELSTNKDRLQELKKNALENSKKFEPQKIKKDFMDLMFAKPYEII